MHRFAALALFTLGCAPADDPATSPADSCDPTPDAGGDVSSVFGTTVSLTAEAECTGRWAWTFVETPEGSGLSQADLRDNGAAYATSFTPDVPGTYVLAVAASDGSRWGPTDVVVVDVTAQDQRPVAHCGSPATGAAGQSVVLDGSASFDPEGATLGYHWVLAGAPSCSELDQGDVSGNQDALFVPDCDGAYTVALTVDDGVHTSGVDFCTVEVATANDIPVADAGPGGSYRLCEGVFVLDGYSSYDTETWDLVYAWRVLEVPLASLATDAQLDDPSVVAPIFHPDQDGEYTFELQVFDGELWSVPDIATYELNVGGCE